MAAETEARAGEDGEEDDAGIAGPSLTRRVGELVDSIVVDLSDRLWKLASDASVASLSVGRALFAPPANRELAVEAGATLRELRELAGLTLDELSDAIRLEDRTLLKAAEAGTATLSFELVLRLSAILARHDPVPVLIQLTRTYDPEVWQALSAFGVGSLPLQFERERRFVNLYRRHDAARKLSDEGFAHVLGVTRTAFEMALHYVAERESIVDRLVEPEPEPSERPRAARSRK